MGEIDSRRRETFAYACEAYSRISLEAHSSAERRALLTAHARGSLPPVDEDEYLDILKEAIEARNGWKRIHARCAPPKSDRRRPNAGSREPSDGAAEA